MDSIGGAKITRGATAGNKNVVLPITIPSVLYGQVVRISKVDIDWVGDTEFEGIAVVLMRRQTGVCAGCYLNIIDSRPAGGYSCQDTLNPTGCTISLTPTGNNVLSADEGAVYLTLELAFVDNIGYVEIGGVRLTLEHK